MTKRQFCNGFLLLFIILENLFLFVFYQQGITSMDVNANCYFAVSLLIGLVVLWKFYNVPQLTLNPPAKPMRVLIIAPLIIACFVLTNSVTIDIIKKISYSSSSDIIIAIDLLCKRLLSGQFVYSPTAMEPLGYHGPTNYLPMHWLPYSLATYFHFDYRSVTFTIWFIGAFIIMLRTLRSGRLWVQVLTPVLLGGCYYILSQCAFGVIGWTVETMVAGYYILLIAALNQKNVFFTGLIVGICLLSRYYIALWLPLAAFVLFVSGNKKELFRVAAVAFAVICILYIIPFLSKDWSALYSSYKDYAQLPLHEWYHVDDNGWPMHLYSGQGLAHYFYERYRGQDLAPGYKWLKRVFYASIFCSQLAMAAWYWLKKDKINYRIYLLVSFKIYLSVFLAFVLIPYVYLMVTANFVSIAIFAEQARYRIPSEPEV